VGGWNNFFFKPISPSSIAIFRVVSGLVILISLIGKYPYRELFYGEKGIVSFHTLDPYFPGPPLMYFRWVPASDPWLNFYFLAIMFFVIALILGFFTRLSSILVFLGLISLNNRNFFVDNAGDHLMRINAFYLMFSQAGKAYSLDKWWKARRGKETRELIPKSPWAQRMLQLQLAYVYLDTVYLKIPGEGWQNGTALYYALNYLELKRLDFKYLFYYLWQIKLATYGVLIAETSMGTLIWFRKLRYWILAAGFLLHFGINLTMQFPVFQYVMMASLINFIYPEDMERFIGMLGGYFRHWLWHGHDQRQEVKTK